MHENLKRNQHKKGSEAVAKKFQLQTNVSLCSVVLNYCAELFTVHKFGQQATKQYYRQARDLGCLQTIQQQSAALCWMLDAFVD